MESYSRSNYKELMKLMLHFGSPGLHFTREPSYFAPLCNYLITKDIVKKSFGT